MQKVVGSSPIIRSTEGPGDGAFFSWRGDLEGELDGLVEPSTSVKINVTVPAGSARATQLFKRDQSEVSNLLDRRHEAEAGDDHRH